MRRRRPVGLVVGPHGNAGEEGGETTAQTKNGRCGRAIWPKCGGREEGVQMA